MCSARVVTGLRDAVVYTTELVSVPAAFEVARVGIGAAVELIDLFLVTPLYSISVTAPLIGHTITGVDTDPCLADVVCRSAFAACPTTAIVATSFSKALWLALFTGAGAFDAKWRAVGAFATASAAAIVTTFLPEAYRSALIRADPVVAKGALLSTGAASAATTVITAGFVFTCWGAPCVKTGIHNCSVGPA